MSVEVSSVLCFKFPLFLLCMNTGILSISKKRALPATIMAIYLCFFFSTAAMLLLTLSQLKRDCRGRVGARDLVYKGVFDTVTFTCVKYILKQAFLDIIKCFNATFHWSLWKGLVKCRLIACAWLFLNQSLSCDLFPVIWEQWQALYSYTISLQRQTFKISKRGQ